MFEKALRDEVHFKSTAVDLLDNDWDDPNYYSFILRKGYSILRMFNHTIGPSFQTAVSRFVSERLSTEVSLFNECLIDASKNKSTAPKDILIGDYINSWYEMDKYPILNVTFEKDTGDLRVDHIQYSFGTDEARHQSVSIPIYYTNDTVKNYDQLELEWIKAPYNSTVVKEAFDPSSNESWAIVNPMGVGNMKRDSVVKFLFFTPMLFLNL